MNVLVLAVLAVLASLASVLTRLRRHGRRRTAGPVSRHAQGPPAVVRVDDGVELHVEHDGDSSAPLTVVMVHGFTARLTEFDLQRAALRSRARIVLYDQRGHGLSRKGPVRRATIDQLGRDLAAVLEQAVPPGPVVLLGHSMGGMTVMALARQRPELFGARVVGVFLLATSSGGLTDAGPAGAAVRMLRALHLLRPWLLWLRLWSPVLERLRRRGTALGRAYTRRYLFGRDDADPALVAHVQELLEQTPLTVTAAFYATLLDHDEVASLEVLRGVPVTILVGDSDRLTPASHSQQMTAALPEAELVVVPGAGHSVNLTRPHIVDAAILRLLDRVAERQRSAAAG
jgi:pimeloyl-ACP methyl ester carboxylesterase